MFGGKVMENIFVTHEMEANKTLVKTLGWHADYCEQALEYDLSHSS
jgi:hypothetical protein